MMTRQQELNDHRFKDLNELSALVLNIIRIDGNPAIRQQKITPAGFASLLLGISLSLMLCGSLTFFIGFFLMPWVIGLLMCFYFLGLLSTISVIARAFLSWNSPPTAAPAASWKHL
ncbi:hypothetical protein ACS0TY_009178 [Phlomoides rotata]